MYQFYHQKLINVCAKRKYNICKKHNYQLTFGSRGSVKLTHIAINNIDPSKLLKIFGMKVKKVNDKKITYLYKIYYTTIILFN